MLQTAPFVKTLDVGGRPVLTDSEGYILNLGDWSEDFARALARQEEPRTHRRALGGDPPSARLLRAARRAGAGARDDPAFPSEMGVGEGQQSLFT